MLFAVVVLIGVVGLGWAGVRVVAALVGGVARATGAAGRPAGAGSAAPEAPWSVEGALTEGELRRLGGLAGSHPRIGRALALRSRILGAVGPAERAPTCVRVDGIVRLLGQHEARLRDIAEAMSAGPVTEAERLRHELRGRLAESTNPHEQRSLRERIAALEAQAQNRARLGQRRALLSSDAERCVLTLENLWMTALDAPVLAPEGAFGHLAAALDELDERSRGLRDRTEADEEIALLLLRPDFAARRAGGRR
jgi:hypothetical protein